MSLDHRENMFKIPVTTMSNILIFLSLLALSTAQQGCPALSCPANCDVARGPNGCNVCNCPQPPVCAPLPGCPSNCQQRFDDAGCPMCDCGSDGNLCAALPSCPRGCIARNPTTNCFICNCSPTRNPFGVGFGNGGFGGGNGFVNGGFGGGNGFGVGAQFGGNNGFGGPGAFGGGVFGNTGFTGQQCRRLQCPLNCRQVMGLDGCMQCMCDDDALLCPGTQVCYDKCQELNENGCCNCNCPVNPGTFFGGPPGGTLGPFGPIPAGAGGAAGGGSPTNPIIDIRFGGGLPPTSAITGPPNSAAERFIPQAFRRRTPNVALLRGRRPSFPLRPTVQPVFERFPVQSPTLQPGIIPQNPQRFPLQTPNFQSGAFPRNPQQFPSQSPNVAFPNIGQRPNFQSISSSPSQGIPIGTNPNGLVPVNSRFPTQSPNVAFPNIGQRPNFQSISSSSAQGIPIGTNPNGLVPVNSRYPSTFVPTVNSQNSRPQQPVQPSKANRVVTLTSVTTLQGDDMVDSFSFNPVQLANSIPAPAPTLFTDPVPARNSFVPVNPQLNEVIPVNSGGTFVQPVASAAAAAVAGVNIPAPERVKSSRVLTLTSVTTISE